MILNKYLLRKITNYSAIIWSLSCFLFVGLIAVMTKLYTHDPNLSDGPETIYLIPMLVSVGVSFLSFCTMVLTFSLSLLSKEKIQYKAPFGITTAKSILLTLLLFVVSIVFLNGVRSGNLGYKQSNYTGQQLYDAINEYRLQNNKKPVPLDLIMCDNLVARYLKIKSGDVGHAGFEEWAKQEEIDKKYFPKAELYVKDTYTVKDAIEFWNGSPGHRLAILSDFDAGCAYSNEGIGVVVYGDKYPQ